MERVIEFITRVTCRKPADWRSPNSEICSLTMLLHIEKGFRFSSKFFDYATPNLHLIDGKPTNFVEFPFA